MKYKTLRDDSFVEGDLVVAAVYPEKVTARIVEVQGGSALLDYADEKGRLLLVRLSALTKIKPVEMSRGLH